MNELDRVGERGREKKKQKKVGDGNGKKVTNRDRVYLPLREWFTKKLVQKVGSSTEGGGGRQRGKQRNKVRDGEVVKVITSAVTRELV